jgi:hypothetical protein
MSLAVLDFARHSCNTNVILVRGYLINLQSFTKDINSLHNFHYFILSVKDFLPFLHSIRNNANSKSLHGRYWNFMRALISLNVSLLLPFKIKNRNRFTFFRIRTSRLLNNLGNNLSRESAFTSGV